MLKNAMFIGVGVWLCTAGITAQELFAGNPPLTPRWAFEPWVWEDNTNTRSSIEAVVRGYADRKIPVGTVIIDSPWETYFNSGVFDAARYPQPQTMIDAFHAQNIKVVLWITGFVNTDNPDHAYVKAQNLGVDNSRDMTWWKGAGIHIDFTNAAAKTWWHGIMDTALNMGIDGWKVDQSADYVPDPVQTSIGQITRQEFKKYYHADMFDYTTAKNPTGITLARAYASGQGGVGASVSKAPLCWQGDFDGDFGANGLPLQVHDVYTSALLGYGCVGVEVGGYFNAAPTKKSLIRSAQFGALTSLMENGGSNGGMAQHLPWYWDAETVAIYRYFAVLHSELVPYNFSYGVEAHLSGISALRNVDTMRTQHTLGNEILATPITADVVARTVHFPAASQWIDYWDDSTVYQGGTSVSYPAPLSRLPIFIKAGAIIPLNVTSDLTGHGDSTSAGKITLLIYPHNRSQFVFHCPQGDGVDYEDVTIAVTQSPDSILISVSGETSSAYRMLVKSTSSPASVLDAESWRFDAEKKQVLVDKTGAVFTVTLRYGNAPVIMHPEKIGREQYLSTVEPAGAIHDIRGRRVATIAGTSVTAIAHKLSSGCYYIVRNHTGEIIGAIVPLSVK